jgi:membrane protein YqaA with SNARE-associated domain
MAHPNDKARSQIDHRRADPVELSTQELAAAEASVGPISRWAIHRRLYDWVLSFAHHKHATPALFALSFAESSFFPIPPDVLLGPLCLGHRKKSLYFATVTTIASVLGAIVGYVIGWGAWEAIHQFVFAYVPGFSQDKFDMVARWYDQWGIWILFAAAFTPIPFKVFTIAGGVFAQPLLPFILVSTVGRGLRFFLVAGLFWWIGPRALPLIDKYFNLLCLAFVLLLVGGFAIIKLLH